MAQRSKANFKSTKNTRFADNSTGDISAQDSRDMFEDVADSAMFLNDNFIDEDSFASNSATKAPSQQSVKAYVDSQLSGSLKTCEVDISTAEILTAFSSPVELVPAPGENKFIQIIGAPVFKYIYSSAAFATNTTVVLTHGSSITTNQLAGVINQTSNQYGCFGSVQWTGVAAQVENQGVFFKVLSGNPTGGGSSTIKISFKYVITDMS